MNVEDAARVSKFFLLGRLLMMTLLLMMSLQRSEAPLATLRLRDPSQARCQGDNVPIAMDANPASAARAMEFGTITLSIIHVMKHITWTRRAYFSGDRI